MKKDITSKEAIKAITQDIATYILKLHIEDIEFVDKELQRIEKREADIVALCKIDGLKSILHLEIQNSNDKNMPLRMLRYFTDIKQRFDNIPIYQYVVYIGKSKLKMKENFQDKSIQYKYIIIDMHTIDCEELIKLDTPDALVLSILCDFKGKDELDVLLYLTRRLEELTKETSNLSKYMLILETLSTNRNLQDTLRKAEKMLRNIRYEDLPSYGIGLEKGIEDGLIKGIEQGIEKSKLESALIMINDFHISPQDVAEKLNISLEKIEKLLQKNSKSIL